MKKLFVAMLYLFVLFIITQMVVLYFRDEHVVDYKLESDEQVFSINENYVADGSKSHYYFEITVNDEKFYLQTYANFYRAQNIIRDIKYKQTEKMSCLLPIFINERIVTDIICHYEDRVYNYTEVWGKDTEIDDYFWESFAYDEEQFADETTNILTDDYISIYLDHVLEKHFLYLNNYRGIDTINKNNLRRYVNVSLFEKDVYNMNLKYLVDEYLVVADYNQDIEFDQFRIVNIKNNNVEDVDLGENVSFNSYIQGRKNKSLYIYDRDEQVQYEFDVNTQRFEKIGSAELGVRVFEDGEWLELTVNDLLVEDRYFRDQPMEKENEYIKVASVLGENGFIYYFLQENSTYHVYRALARQPDYKKYLFSTENDNMRFVRDFVYFQDGNFIRYYSDQTGIKTIAENQEFSFNKNLDFDIFINQ